MDLIDEVQVENSILEIQPEAVIHTAALTEVDGCERDPQLAMRINVAGTKHLARWTKEVGANFVYISTDYVFDGERGNYLESDLPSPVSVYGKSKLMGEEVVKSFCPHALVIRTSIFGFNVQPKIGPVESIIGHLQEGKGINRFSDQFFSPIYTGDLNRIILELLARRCEGLFHVGGKGRLSRYEFALKVAETFNFPHKKILPVPFEPFSQFARRPKDSSLDGGKVERKLGIQLPKVEDGLKRLREEWTSLRH